MTFASYSPIILNVADLVALPTAWVVKCKKCGCTVTYRAIDSQLEHAEPEKAEPPPPDTVIVTVETGVTQYQYDGLDRLTQILDAANNSTVFQWDSLSRSESITDLLGLHCDPLVGIGHISGKSLLQTLNCGDTETVICL